MDISDFLVTYIKNNVFNSNVLRLMRLLGNDLNVRSIAFNSKNITMYSTCSLHYFCNDIINCMKVVFIRVSGVLVS